MLYLYRLQLVYSLLLIENGSLAWQQRTIDKSRRAWLAQTTNKVIGSFLVVSSSPIKTLGFDTDTDDTDDDDDDDSSDSLTATSSIPPRQDRRPYAPTEALVPAMEQRILLQTAVDLSQQLVASSDNKRDVQQRIIILQQLQHLLDPPSASASASSVKFAIGATKRYPKATSTTTTTSIKPSSTTPATLSGAATRAAMNYYTSQLRFADSYTLTASPSEKSRLLRTVGQFPNVKQVITADLDLRDLYRNQVQTTLDDLAAQVHVVGDDDIDTDSLDASEIVRLAKDAASAFDQWLSFIDGKDIQATQARAVQLQ